MYKRIEDLKTETKFNNEGKEKMPRLLTLLF